MNDKRRDRSLNLGIIDIPAEILLQRVLRFAGIHQFLAPVGRMTQDDAGPMVLSNLSRLLLRLRDKPISKKGLPLLPTYLVRWKFRSVRPFIRLVLLHHVDSNPSHHLFLGPLRGFTSSGARGCNMTLIGV